MRKTDDHLRVRVERGARWVLEQYRSEGARGLVNKARAAAAQLLTPPGTAPRPVPRDSAPWANPRPNPADELHNVLAGMCAGVALRDLNLVDSLLAQLEDMEANESDPDALARLYQLDHLAARIRRNAENLRVLSGHDAGRAANAALPLIDVIRAAMSSIEQYRRIEIGRVAALAVVDFAADDISRLLSELLDNAASHSPPTSKVTVSAHLTEQSSVLLRIEDAGIGLPPERLGALNARLSATPRLDSGAIEHMGLAVVRRLAGKYGIRVTLNRRAAHGTTAAVLLPVSLVCEAPASSWLAETPTMRLPRPAPAPARAQAGLPPHPRPSPERAERDEALVAPEVTRNGLPRRVPQSLREFATFGPSAPAPREEFAVDGEEVRERLIADLGDFTAGEQAARDEGRAAGPRLGPAEEPGE